MPKTRISEYSTTNSDNTDIESINIAEGCAPSGINNAIRELMVHLKEFQTGASGDAFTFAGGVLISGTANTITGNVLMSGTNTITGSTTATFAAGAVGTPSIAAHGDTNTGIFFPAADTIAFAEGGAEAMRIDSSGNLCLGVTPSAWINTVKVLDLNTGASIFGTTSASGFYTNAFINGSSQFIYKTSAAASTYVQSGGEHIWSTAPSGTAGNTITFTERMRINSSGNVGIGTSSPTQRLQVVNSAGDSTVLVSSTVSGATGSLLMRHVYGTATYMGMTSATGDYGLLFSFAGTALGVGTFNSVPLLFGTANSERMRITSSGNVGIGTSSPNSKLVVSNGGAAGLEVEPVLRDGLTVGASFLSYNRSGAAFVPMQFSGADLRFATSDTERARITSGGDFLIGTTATFTTGDVNDGAGSQYIAQNGSAALWLKRAGSNGDIAVFIRGGITNPVGSISITTTATAYNTSSDYRLKENIAPMTGALTRVAALKPCTYKWKADGSDGEGFIAHELAEIVPQCVTGEKDAVDAEGKPVYQGIDTSFLVATLTAAIQELKAEVDALKAELANK